MNDAQRLVEALFSSFFFSSTSATSEHPIEISENFSPSIAQTIP